MLLKKFKKLSLFVLLLSLLMSPFNSLSSFASEAKPSNNVIANQNAELQFNTVDDYAAYIAYSVKNNSDFVVIKPYAVGEMLDLKDSIYFWTKTKTGACISKVINPVNIAKGVLFGFSPKQLKKMGIKGFARKLAKSGLQYGVAYGIAECIFTYWGK
ncbi:hypothetical protein [Peptostreptococcus sp. D1]|uniref:hypothetical protein n=1 Tax=Peptostreptococcus sp. D1 TaxID=72304 RepID=UPI0008E900AA|nr:hypothetical protein [Peptostreptococcus sp. D1]SFE68141.1 hypothetical protein SAMN02910278_01443 [Peptostreptococcus sp. D1]